MLDCSRQVLGGGARGAQRQEGRARRHRPSAAILVAVGLEADLDRAGLAHGGPGFRHVATRPPDQLQHLEGVEQLAVLGRAERSLRADLEQGAVPVHQLQEAVLVGVHRQLDQLLDLVTRFEDRLFPPHPGHHHLGVRGALDALQDDLPHGQLDVHRVGFPVLADAEGDAALLPGEQAPDDRLDLLADGVIDLAGRQQALFHEQHAVALVGALALAHRGVVLLPGQQAGGLEIAPRLSSRLFEEAWTTLPSLMKTRLIRGPSCASKTPGTWNRSTVCRISGSAVCDRSPRYWKLFSAVPKVSNPRTAYHVIRVNG